MYLFIYVACNNTVGKLALMALNLWMIMNLQGWEHFILK
jgi:hypothetical protein